MTTVSETTITDAMAEVAAWHSNPLPLCHPQGLPRCADDLPRVGSSPARMTTRTSVSESIDDGDEFDEHDRFFAVRRSCDQPMATYLRSSHVIHARIAAHQTEQECGAAEDRNVLLGGHRCLALWVNTDAMPGVCPSVARVPEESMRDCRRPHEHWLLGHQLFFVLIQGIIAGLQCLTTAGRDRDLAGQHSALRFAADMCHHSAVAMRYTGIFDPLVYNESVRPSMTPPTVRTGFSGFQTRDHMYLVKALRNSRAAFEQLGGDSLAVAQFQSALGEVYAAHEMVCARFDGDHRPSLLMEATGGRLGQTPGVAVIRKLAARRVALVTDQPR